MPQIKKGTIYSTGMQVTATNLNDHVGNAELMPGAISDWPTIDPNLLSPNAFILLNQSENLVKATVAQVSGTLNTTGFIKADGSVAMSGQLTLLSTAPVAALHAASKGYVDAQITSSGLGYTPVNKAGDTMSGNLNMGFGSVVVLNTIGTSDLSAVNKQYVSQQLASFAAGTAPGTALSNHLTDYNNPHKVQAVQLGLGAFVSLSPSTLSISTATQAALDQKLSLFPQSALTGPLNLSTDAITALSQATNKQYVDTADALKLDKAGGTVTGPVNFTSSAILSLTPAVQTSQFSAVTVQQLNAATIQQPRIVACGFLQTGSAVSAPINVLNESTFLTVSATRSAGSSNITINYSALGSDYANADRPFFLVNQFVGIKAATNVSAALYKIISTDINNKTFLCTPQGSAAFPTTAFTSVSVQLSCVYNNRNATDAATSNIKSIYIDLGCANKYYVNYINDTSTGSQTNETPSVVKTAFACGNATTYGGDGSLWICVNIGTNINHQNTNAANGLGATTTGSHVGYFTHGVNGMPNNYVYAASLAIGQR